MIMEMPGLEETLHHVVVCDVSPPEPSSFHLCFLISSFCLEATGLLLLVLQRLKSLRFNFSRMDLALGMFPSPWQSTHHGCPATGLHLQFYDFATQKNPKLFTAMFSFELLSIFHLHLVVLTGVK